MALCGWCLDGLCEDCRDGEFSWRCTCGHEVKTGSWVSAGGRHCWRCPRCFWGRGFATPAEADQAHGLHACAWRGVDMTEGKSLVTQAWEQLDQQVLEIIALDHQLNTNLDPEGLVSDNLLVARARARGKAEILALFMTPTFTTADQIAEESTRRYQARLAGVAYVTPGLTS